MTDNVAVLQGYTKEYFASCDECDMPILVRPNTNFDDRFKAWDMDEQEFIHINGWLWIFEPIAHDC